MNCYDCAMEGNATPAVGVCVLCGAAVCTDHAVRQRLPQWRTSGGGIGGPAVRAPHDRRRLVCELCHTHSWAGERGAYFCDPVRATP